jgi:exopolysaccharide production protein ExoQ
VAVFAMLSLGAVGMAVRLSSRDLMSFAFAAGLFTLSFGLICEIYLGTFHPLSVGYRFSGLMPPLYQAINNCMLIIAALALSGRLKSGRFLYYLVAFGAFLFIILSKARWPMFAISLTILSSWIRVLSRARLLAYAGLIVCAGCLIYFVAGDPVYSLLHSSISLGRDTSSASTFTGRLPVWKEGIRYFWEQPLIGYGYDSFWTTQRFLKVARASEFAVADFHNGYLNLAIGLGIPGLTAGVLILAIATAKLHVLSKVSCRTYNVFATNMLVMLMLNMFLMTLFPGGHFSSFVSMTIIARLAFAGEPHCQPARLCQCRTTTQRLND